MSRFRRFFSILLAIVILPGFLLLAGSSARADPVMPELGITGSLSNGTDPVKPGTVMDLQIEVKNYGLVGADGVNVVLTLPPGLEFADLPVSGTGYRNIALVSWCILHDDGTGDPPRKSCGIGYNLFDNCTFYGAQAASCPLDKRLAPALLYQGNLDPALYRFWTKVKVSDDAGPGQGFVTGTVQSSSPEADYTNNTTLLPVNIAAG